jgi:predicted nucleic acid-binding Zn ribbon protein
MTKQVEPEPGQHRPRHHEGVLCAKCQHLNPAAQTTCELCGARLYITCEKCGRQNKRVATRCSECHARLHRSVWKRWRHALVSRRSRITPFQIAGAIVAAYFVYRVIVMLAEYSPASAE